MGDVKYIIFDNTFPAIFNAGIQHSHMKVRGMMPTSAGFVGVDANGKPYAYGESISLGIKSNPAKDNIILGMMFDNM